MDPDEPPPAFCGQCGQQVAPAQRFCGRCRQPLSSRAGGVAGRPGPDRRRRPRQAVDPSLLWTGGGLVALLAFVAVEIVGSVGLSTPALRAATEPGAVSSLDALESLVAVLAYGGSVVAALVATLLVAWWASRSHRRQAAACTASLVGVLGSLGLGVIASTLTEQPVLQGTVLTHVAFAAAGVLAGTALATVARASNRPRVATLVAGALGSLIVAQVAMPGPSLAAGDIEAGACRLESWSGSLDGEITLFSFDAGAGFEFSIGRNLDDSWELETAGSLKAGLSLMLGKKVKVPDLGGLLESAGGLSTLTAANIGLEVKSDGVVRVGHRYHFETATELQRVLLGSLVTFAWHGMAPPGLGALLGPAPTLAAEYQLPVPVETQYDIGTESSLSLRLGPVSLGGALTSGVRVRFHSPLLEDAATVDVGFPTTAIVSGELSGAVVPGLDMSMGGEAGGDVYTYLTFDRTNEDLTLEGLSLSAIGISASGSVWSPPDTAPGLGTSLLGRYVDQPGPASTLSMIEDVLGPLAAETTTANLEASLEGLSDSGMVAAILTVVLFDIKVVDADGFAALAEAYPGLDAAVSDARVLEALDRIVSRSDANMVITSSRGVDLGIGVKGGTGLSSGFELNAGGSHEVLVSASVIDATLGMVDSRTCAPDMAAP